MSDSLQHRANALRDAGLVVSSNRLEVSLGGKYGMPDNVVRQVPDNGRIRVSFFVFTKTAIEHKKHYRTLFRRKTTQTN